MLEQLKPAQNFSLQIFATDLDRGAIDKAREAVFPANIVADVSPERLIRYFAEVDRGYQVAKPIRDMVIFAPQNIIMDILYITGRTGKYLEPAAGKANWNIFAMTREGLHYELSDTFKKALRQKKTVTFKNAVVKINGGVQAVNITVQPLEEPEALRGMVMIVFTDVATSPQIKTMGTTSPIPILSQRDAELERELMQAHQELQVTRTEMQPTHEELQSTNGSWKPMPCWSNR